MANRNTIFVTIATTLTITLTILLGQPTFVTGQYHDVRCKCICPVPSVVSNNSNSANSTRKLYIGNRPPNECNCDFVVLPQLEPDIQSKAKEFCPRCECVYESRNTSIIRFFVIFIIGMISFLGVYMFFLMILEPWMQHQHSGRNNYEQFNEEMSTIEEQHQRQTQQGGGEAQDSVTSPSSITGEVPRQRRAQTLPYQFTDDEPPRGVFNRVGHSQSKWKRQVMEQRRNIYDDHTMLD